MLKVVLIGTGKVAKHLFDAFRLGNAIEVVQVIGRHSEPLRHFDMVSTNLIAEDHVLDANIYIIAVSDGAIGEVSRSIKNSERFVVHTSGSIPMNVLSGHNRRGVLYPLQTFSSERAVDFKKIPLCLEAKVPKDLKLLRKLALSISDMVFEIDSDQRKYLHLAAVFANNFTNHMYVLADQICKENGLPFEMLKPLILETAKKIENHDPLIMLTGPALRQDLKVLKMQSELLGTGTRAALYELISKSIQNQKNFGISDHDSEWW